MVCQTSSEVRGPTGRHSGRLGDAPSRTSCSHSPAFTWSAGHGHGGESSLSEDGAAWTKARATPCTSPAAARAFLHGEEEEREGQRLGRCGAGVCELAPRGNVFAGTHGHESFLLLGCNEWIEMAERGSPGSRVTAGSLSRALTACKILAFLENKNVGIRQFYLCLKYFACKKENKLKLE